MKETVFHKILSGSIPSAKIYEDDNIYAFMDAFPQAKGHALIIPKYYAAENLFDMNDEVLAKIIQFSRRLACAQKKVFQPDGLKVMQFNGEVAGQTVFYYHMHLLPVYQNQVESKHADKAVDLEILKEQAKALSKALVDD
ncbi:purine nucleoside phosphoramidase [Suttonella ornithocola]|uniref:Purine nucleoside phosphoramidase n=2 Tax=Suttonella ornithocola TaxID=279832 RepID=A0A380MX03_9GAMM|nr:purine nucleoside phosphoramidase [Suttonella ornithocola]